MLLLLCPFPACQSERPYKQILCWCTLLCLHSFANLNRWCNEIVSAATLVSSTTLISAIQLHSFFFFSCSKAWKAGALVRRRLPDELWKKEDEELKPSATVLDLGSVSVFLCVSFLSFCCSSWGLFATSQPTRLGDKTEECAIHLTGWSLQENHFEIKFGALRLL